MALRNRLLFCFFVLCQFVNAQERPVTLDEVEVSDTQLRQFSDAKSVLLLNDSVIRKNQSSLTSLLNFNSIVYFKENGLGMVSSPSFRGTTAQQTAVIWNGININSQLNGQTDFNTITTKDFSSIVIRGGGGSGIYGSSAIGGTIHLNNDIVFDQGFSNESQLNYGSFNTLGIHNHTKYSNSKFSVSASVSGNVSDNDYPYINSDKRNENGQFNNSSYNLGVGYKLNSNNSLKFYSQIFNSKRHFSLISSSDSKTMYKDFNTRNLAEWSSYFGRFVSKAKIAFLTERYRYFENIDLGNYTYGKTQTAIAKYELSHELGEKAKLQYVVDYTQTTGNGSDIATGKREIGSGSVLFKHSPITMLTYDFVVRKEITSNYKSPLLFSAGGVYSFSEMYRLKLNASTNFRIPSFNDLYWQGAGNPNLKPESSRQVEIGNEFRFKNFKLSATFYATKIRDMIRWIPGSGGIFAPENVGKVSIFGAEILMNAFKQFGRNRFEINSTYAYTNSKNELTEKQLIYVPYHKATASFGYSIGKFSATLHYLFVGKAFTQSDNNPLTRIPLFHISNLGAAYDLGKKHAFEIGGNLQNIGNVNYQSTEGRYMPGRNFNVFVNLKF